MGIPAKAPSPKSYLGLDLSTQSLTLTLLTHPSNSTFAVETFTTSVNFENDCGDSGLREDGTQDATVWLTAFNLLCKKLKSNKVWDRLRSSVVAVSFSAQQHGTCWLKSPSKFPFPKDSFSEFKSLFATTVSPIWLHSSASGMLDAMTAEHPSASLPTGCALTSRFSGPVIAYYLRNKQNVYDATERIMLITELMLYMCTGEDHSVLDESDAAGTNMFDLEKRSWCGEVCSILFGDKQHDVKNKVAKTVCKGTHVLGNPCSFFAEKMGIPETTKVVIGTGDNPSSFCSSKLVRNELIISLGTSDTVLGLVPSLTSGSSSTLSNFRDPRTASSYVRMLCFSNGGKLRESYCEKYAGGNWNTFDSLVETQTHGKWNLHVDVPEITPFIKSLGKHTSTSDISNKEMIASLVQTRVMSMYLHSKRCEMHSGKVKRILVTGGGSKSGGICRVISSVFGCPVYVQDGSSGGASYGAAIRAMYGKERGGSGGTFNEICGKTVERGWRKFCDGGEGDEGEEYERLRGEYERFEDGVVAAGVGGEGDGGDKGGGGKGEEESNGGWWIGAGLVIGVGIGVYFLSRRGKK